MHAQMQQYNLTDIYCIVADDNQTSVTSESDTTPDASHVSVHGFTISLKDVSGDEDLYTGKMCCLLGNLLTKQILTPFRFLCLLLKF